MTRPWSVLHTEARPATSAVRCCSTAVWVHPHPVARSSSPAGLAADRQAAASCSLLRTPARAVRAGLTVLRAACPCPCGYVLRVLARRLGQRDTRRTERPQSVPARSCRPQPRPARAMTSSASWGRREVGGEEGHQSTQHSRYPAPVHAAPSHRGSDPATHTHTHTHTNAGTSDSCHEGIF